MTKKEDDSRYPYIHACDFVRNAAPWDESGCTMSRSTASQIRALFSLALGVDDKEVAEKLADAFLRYEPMIYIFKTDDRLEKVDVPIDAIGYKIVTFAGMKQAHWLQPRRDVD